MKEKTINKLKKEFVNKKVLSVIGLNILDSEIANELKKICNQSYSSVDNAELILFEDKTALVFVDFDCDGYRSGDWNLVKLKNVLDKGYTKEIKNINSVLRNIEYFENMKQPNDYSDSDGVLLTTDEYVIKMGQDNSDSYYPSNFFDISECKLTALGEAEVIF